MKGKIEEISEAESKNGQRYLRLTIDGQRYILWDEALFEQLQEGDIVEFAWKESGNGFRKIAEMQVIENGNGQEQPSFDRNTAITRLACLKASCTLLSNLDVESEQKVTKAVAVAREFEGYVNGCTAPEAGS